MEKDLEELHRYITKNKKASHSTRHFAFSILNF